MHSSWRERLFITLSLSACGLALLILLLLVGDILSDGSARLSWSFFTSYASRSAEKAGILAPLVGSIYLILLTALIAFPLGVGAAIHLEEYAARSRLTRIIELNIANLAGVPSIIYGILGLQLFVRWLHLGRSLLAAALTLALLILPVIVIVSREAIRQVPQSLRQASLALGATRWQTTYYQVLPAALPGIMTGCILAFSRALGETAPLVAIGALTYVAYLPDSPLAGFTALPIQAFNWISRPQEAFHRNAAAAILVLLCILLLMNSVAIILRGRGQRKIR